MKKKLTPAMKRQITKQWQEEFPSMGIYRNMQLAQILGPIAVCVFLEVKSDPSSYEPKIHLDDLTRDFSDVRPLGYLSGYVEVPHVRISTISKPDKYLTIASQLKELFYLPLEGDMRIEDLIACLKKECRDGDYGMTYALLRILVMIAYWSGKQEIISDVHSFMMELIPSLVSRRIFSNYEKAENCCKEIIAETPGTEELRKNYNENLMREDFKHIPRRNVIL